jgi:hypothetical protein
MAGHGNINLRTNARITNLLAPLTDNEPGLARDSCFIPFTGGRFFSQAVNSSPATTVNTVANLCRFSILELRSSVVISSIRTEVTAPVASALYRTCIYNCNSLLYPTTLVADGLVDQNVPTGGVKITTLASNISLRAGLYLLGIKCNLAFGMRALDPRAISAALGATGTGNLLSITGYTVPFAWAPNTAFPATFPALAVTNLTAVAQPIHVFTSV